MPYARTDGNDGIRLVALEYCAIYKFTNLLTYWWPWTTDVELRDCVAFMTLSRRLITSTYVD